MRPALPIVLVFGSNPVQTLQIMASRISVEGLWFQSDRPLNLPDIIELELSTSLGKLNVKATWQKKRETEYECRFISLDSQSVKVLNQWLFPPFEP